MGAAVVVEIRCVRVGSEVTLDDLAVANVWVHIVIPWIRRQFSRREGVSALQLADPLDLFQSINIKPPEDLRDQARCSEQLDGFATSELAARRLGSAPLAMHNRAGRRPKYHSRA